MNDSPDSVDGRPDPAGAAGAAPAPGDFYDGDDGLGIRDFFAMLHRHRWSALFVFALVVLAATLYTLRRTPVYECTPALLEVTADNAGIATIKDVFERQAVSLQNFQTQVNLLQSEGILRTAYDSCPPIASKMSFPAFQRAVSVDPVRDSFLVKITFESPWPELSPAAANAVARTYIETGRAQREDRTSKASVELGRRRDEVRKELEAAEKKLADFRTENQVADVKAEKANADGLVADFESRYDRQQLELVSLEEAHREVEAARAKGDLTQVGEVLKDPGFQEIERSIREAEAEKFKLLREFTEDAPALKLVEQQIVALEKRREALIRAIVGQIETAFENAKQAVEKIRELRDQRRAEQKNLSRLLIEQTNLEAERDRLRRDLDDLVKQASDVQGSTGFDLAPAILQEEARVSDVQVKPKPLRDISIAAFLGLFLALGTAWLLERFNDAAIRPDDVTRATGLPVLGMLPRTASPKTRPDVAALEDPRSELAEAIRMIRTGILFTPSGRTKRARILVTSAEKGEGKTLLSVNLAAALAQTGQRTLLVDADLRNPRVHRVFGVDNARGLSHIFANGRVLPETQRVERGGVALEVIPSGPMPPNPAELLGGERMTEFLDEVSGKWDRVVLDSPPAGPVSDPLLLARQCDGVILVVRLGSTSIRAIRRACEHLHQVGAPLLGVVLNGVTMGGGYYYYYYHRYGYYGRYGKRKKDRAAEAEVEASATPPEA